MPCSVWWLWFVKCLFFIILTRIVSRRLEYRYYCDTPIYDLGAFHLYPILATSRPACLVNPTLITVRLSLSLGPCAVSCLLCPVLYAVQARRDKRFFKRSFFFHSCPLVRVSSAKSSEVVWYWDQISDFTNFRAVLGLCFKVSVRLFISSICTLFYVREIEPFTWRTSLQIWVSWNVALDQCSTQPCLVGSLLIEHFRKCF